MRIIGGAVCAAAAAACLVAALAGCDDGGGDATQQAAVDAGRLKVLLGGIEDMPQGFSDHQREQWKPPFRAKSGDCRVLFDAAAGRPPTRDLVAGTATTYEGKHVGETAAVGLAVYGDNAAGGVLGRLERAMRSCRVAAAGGPGKGDRLRASRLPIKDVGDDVEARRLRGRVGGYPYEMHLVVARQGDALITLVHGGVASADVKGTAALARVLVGRVSTLDL
ncbi:hypothetical protein [Microtetraspora fusca]|uniref:Sensor domain-containing protein n=1 Tax=Microtetraspora fusca TaxID=1997 RepID=A0ABW6V2Z0_MICFU|nr:hypothetical protein [Microtetraspora fusca]